jgi:hypothetical protein
LPIARGIFSGMLDEGQMATPARPLFHSDAHGALGGGRGSTALSRILRVQRVGESIACPTAGFMRRPLRIIDEEAP